MRKWRNGECPIGAATAIVAIVVCLGMSACGGSGTGGQSLTNSRVTSTSPSIVGTFATHTIPPGQSIRGDGDADNPSDIDGNGDRDNEDGDNDRPTPESYRYPDPDDKATLGFGHAATDSERRAIASAIKQLYVAAAAGDGTQACRLMLPAFARSMAESYGAGAGPSGSSYLRSARTCQQVASLIFAHFHGELTEAITILAVRVNGHLARTVFSSRKIPASEEALQREGDSWKIVGLLGVPLT